jgi:hypothetical protein
MMQTALVAIALASVLATIVLAGVRERLSSKWQGHIGILQVLCVVLWLGSVVLMLVFSPGLVSSTPDPRF